MLLGIFNINAGDIHNFLINDKLKKQLGKRTYVCVTIS